MINSYLGGDGNAYQDGGTTWSTPRYAEMFEWEDGNPDNEDRKELVFFCRR
ncbi:MAG: hypothetical protein CM15mV58_650 [uncultured marine virus]|nr:MAG: hypothetical protein CM15mV58_650 [uncultured marine virus]